MMVGYPRRRLSWTEARLLFAVGIVQLAVGAALRVMPVRVLSSAIARHRGAARLLRAPEERVGWAIEAVGRRLPWISTCLVRALAADLFLGGAPRPGCVKIGVRRSNGGLLESHAWFEREGRILVGGAGADGYVEFATLQVGESRTVHHESETC